MPSELHILDSDQPLYYGGLTIDFKNIEYKDIRVKPINRPDINWNLLPLLPSAAIDFDGIIANPHRNNFLDYSDLATDRVSTGLEAGASAGNPYFYYQGIEGTCAVWSLGNALNFLDVEIPNQHFLSFLQEVANGGKGFNLLKLEDKVNSWYGSDSNPVTVNTVIENWNRTLPGQAIPMELFGKIFYMPAKSLTRPNYDSRYIPELARTFRENISKDSVLLASVNVKDWLKGKGIYFNSSTDTTTHAITIAGYVVGINGEMDIQVIDSNIGSVWIPLEHLNISLTDSAPLIKVAKRLIPV